MTKISVVTILSVFGVVVCQVVDSLPVNNSFRANYKYAQQFKCKQPQPRSVRIIDEIQTAMQGKRVIPRMTVLDRCDSGSGCCLNGDERMVCGPVDTEDVKLTFRVTYTVDTEEHKAGDSEEETMVLKNHTKCGCIIPSDESK